MNIKSKILGEIKLSYDTAVQKADANLRMALENPTFKKNFTRIKELNFQIAKKEFEKQPCKEEKVELKNEIEKMKVLLFSLKLKKSDFEPQFSCKKCNDSGYIGNKLCDCYYKRLNDYIVSGISSKINKDHSFKNSNFTIFDDPIKTEALYKKIQAWCDKTPHSPIKNMLLRGTTGVGKTFLAECISNRLLDRFFSVGFYSAFALNNVFLKFHTTFDDTKSFILDGVLNCDTLVIDDLGSEQKYRNVTDEYLYLVLNERLMNNKSTIITTNCTGEDLLNKYGERVFSRIFNKQNTLILNLENEDLRKIRKK